MKKLILASSIAALLISGLLQKKDLEEPAGNQIPLTPDLSIQDGKSLEAAPASASGRELVEISEPLG